MILKNAFSYGFHAVRGGRRHTNSSMELKIGRMGRMLLTTASLVRVCRLDDGVEMLSCRLFAIKQEVAKSRLYKLNNLHNSLDKLINFSRALARLRETPTQADVFLSFAGILDFWSRHIERQSSFLMVVAVCRRDRQDGTGYQKFFWAQGKPGCSAKVKTSC